nr:MAG TPA: hypothetical protein [Caudoviricetes sp.]
MSSEFIQSRFYAVSDRVKDVCYGIARIGRVYQYAVIFGLSR